MIFLARKISQAKWEQSPDLAQGEIQADAVTADLRTMGNTLSFWHCENSTLESELCQAVLALTTNKNTERFNTVDLAWIDPADLRKSDITIKQTPGNTVVESLKDKHRDLVGLDLNRLDSLAQLMNTAIRQGQKKRFSKKKVAQIVIQAVQENLLKEDALHQNLQTEILKLANKSLGQPKK